MSSPIRNSKSDSNNVSEGANLLRDENLLPMPVLWTLLSPKHQFEDIFTVIEIFS